MRINYTKYNKCVLTIIPNTAEAPRGIVQPCSAQGHRIFFGAQFRICSLSSHFPITPTH